MITCTHLLISFIMCKVICLLDVFTSNLSYDDFEDIYLVTQLMESDLSEVVRTQKLTDEHVQFLIYQILRGLKVKMYVYLLTLLISEVLFCSICIQQE